MSTQSYVNASDALPNLLYRILKRGEVTPSRNGETKELLMEQFTLRNPRQRYITTPGRRVSLPAQIAETMWLLAGRNDIGWLENYLPRAKDFSDDGEIWRGAYGPRIRKWQSFSREAEMNELEITEIDQLAHVVQLLKEDPGTRRAVITIYDPAIDSVGVSKDRPCNNWVHFVGRNGFLHGHVTIRSNDVFWGWSGINQFEWSALLEIVAGLVGMQVGTLTFSVSSLHLYDRHYDRAQELADSMRTTVPPTLKQAPGFKMRPGCELDSFDLLVQKWFRIEQTIREEPRGSAFMEISNFPEPMLQSWLFALYAWWHDDIKGIFEENSATRELAGTDLEACLLASPKRKKPMAERDAVAHGPVGLSTSVHYSPDGQGFVEFVAQLHREKHAAYGDSWKKRGEMLGIMANIARKMDRLGVAGGGDTAADTAIDLLVYLIKYRLWLCEQWSAPIPMAIQSISSEDLAFSDDPERVTEMLDYLPKMNISSVQDLLIISGLEANFRTLERVINDEETSLEREDVVDRMIPAAYTLALRLWTKEEKAKWKAENEKRIWKGYDA